MANVDSITVRMYNTGSVGDCLLLLFKKNNIVTYKMLIDCGGFNTTKANITACVQDIRDTIQDDILDLVVVTHEHLDHVSGFNQVRSIFDKIKFKNVWMAWTENPNDPIAKKLKKEKGMQIQAIKEYIALQRKFVLKKLKSNSLSATARSTMQSLLRQWEALETGLKFEEGVHFEKSKPMALKVSDAMKYVKSKYKSTPKSKIYRTPGEVIQGTEGTAGINFHILGPPYDQDLNGILNLMQYDEMYSFRKGVQFRNARAYQNSFDASSGVTEIKSPFHKKYILQGAEVKEFYQEYQLPDNRWRQIEEIWLESPDYLAIDVNSFTNNTSLVIAIEFADSKKVLLFPADAQSGNWISWHNKEVTQKLEDNGGKSAKLLLKNTVLYKVGHHGSHNGTASTSGLEQMTKSNLVAMLPLVQDKVPSQWGGSDNFPAKGLYEKLIEQTNGAVLRTDVGLITDGDASARRANLSAAMRKKLREADHTLYQEWTVVN